MKLAKIGLSLGATGRAIVCLIDVPPFECIQICKTYSSPIAGYDQPPPCGIPTKTPISIDSTTASIVPR